MTATIYVHGLGAIVVPLLIMAGVGIYRILMDLLRRSR